MPPGKDPKIIEDERVKAWIKRVDPICPHFAMRLAYMVLLPAQIIRYESFQGTLVSAAVFQVKCTHSRFSDNVLPAPRLAGASLPRARGLAAVEHPPARHPVLKITGEGSKATDNP